MITQKCAGGDTLIANHALVDDAPSGSSVGRPCQAPRTAHTPLMVRLLLMAVVVTLLSGCKFDPDKEMAACKKAHPNDDQAVTVCFSKAQTGHRRGIAGVSADGD